MNDAPWFRILPKRPSLYMWRGQLCEEVLDQMARRIKLSVIVARRRLVGSRWNLRGLAGGRQRLKVARLGVGCLVGDERIDLDCGQQVVGPDQVVCLAAGQEEVDRVAQRVDQGVDLGAQSAARAPDRWSSPAFFGRRRFADGRA